MKRCRCLYMKLYKKVFYSENEARFYFFNVFSGYLSVDMLNEYSDGSGLLRCNLG